MRYVVTCTQIVDTPSDVDDAVDLNLGFSGHTSAVVEADSEEEALDEYHAGHPIGCLEDYAITVEEEED